MMPPLEPLLSALDRALRDQNRRAIEQAIGPSRAHLLTCSDCGRPGGEGYHSLPTAHRVLCDPCYRWRAGLGIDGPFDPRTRRQLEATVGSTAA